MAEEEKEDGATLISRPLERERSDDRYCVRCLESNGGDPDLIMRCGRCLFVCYCSEECQRLHYASHRDHCRRIPSVVNGAPAVVPISGGNSSPSPNRNHIECGDLLLEAACEYFCSSGDGNDEDNDSDGGGSNDRKLTVHGRSMLENALDQYLKVFERVRGGGAATASDGTMLSPEGSAALCLGLPDDSEELYRALRVRIPFLLAALGHDAEAIAEVYHALSGEGRLGPPPPTKAVAEDLIEQLWLRGTSIFHWPSVLIVPVLLAKMRLVLDLRAQKRRFDESFAAATAVAAAAGTDQALASTAAAAADALEPVASVIDGFVKGGVSALLREQERQLRLFSFFLEHKPGTDEYDVLTIILDDYDDRYNPIHYVNGSDDDFLTRRHHRLVNRSLVLFDGGLVRAGGGDNDTDNDNDNGSNSTNEPRALYKILRAAFFDDPELRDLLVSCRDGARNYRSIQDLLPSNPMFSPYLKDENGNARNDNSNTTDTTSTTDESNVED